MKYTCTVVRREGLDNTRKWPASGDLKRTRLPSATDRNATPGTVSHTARCRNIPNISLSVSGMRSHVMRSGTGTNSEWPAYRAVRDAPVALVGYGQPPALQIPLHCEAPQRVTEALHARVHQPALSCSQSAVGVVVGGASVRGKQVGYRVVRHQPRCIAAMILLTVPQFRQHNTQQHHRRQSPHGP
jgi:hypothetical protein